MAPTEAGLVIEQLIQEIAGGHFDLVGELLALAREACFVNLFFFLKYVAGYSGPYNELNASVHLDMCNFRQSPLCMRPGARAGMFAPRSYNKSTIVSHGADQWEILRWPNIRISMRNAIFDRASGFVNRITDTFSKNELVRILLEEYWVSNPRQQGCNDFEFMCPARNRQFTEPTVKAGAVSGSVEGDHFDLFNCDDPTGMDDLDADRQSNVNMERKKKWFSANHEALLVKPALSRVVVAGTRFGPDDLYEPMFQDAKSISGFQPTWLNTKPEGKWDLYYRMGRENGKPTNPDLYSEAILERMAREDVWYYLTQIQNSPYSAGLTEFNRIDVPVGRCVRATLLYNDGREEEDFLLTRDLSMDPARGDPYVRLSNCEVIGMTDPAATVAGPDAKACRTATGILAMDPEGWVYLVKCRAGMWDILKAFDVIFELAAEMRGYVRWFGFEKSGFQKILAPLLAKERERRSVWVDFEGIQSEGDKVARIRSVLGRQMLTGHFCVMEEALPDFEEEKRVFPQSRYRMDVLDMVQMGISALTRPQTEEERSSHEVWEEIRLRELSPSTGY